MNAHPPILDYSSPAQEQKLEDQREDERRIALRNYNLATFGESGLIGYDLLRMAVFFAIVGWVTWFLPRWLDDVIGTIAPFAYILWEWRRTA